jgi:hypothetical protein
MIELKNVFPLTSEIKLSYEFVLSSYSSLLLKSSIISAFEKVRIINTSIKRKYLISKIEL